MASQNLRKALIDALEQIEDNANSFEERGRESAYQAVAIQLRKLLTDKHPLLPRVLPDFKLERLRPPADFWDGDKDRREGRWVVMAVDPRGVLELGGGRVVWKPEVSPGDFVAVDEWIDDWVLNPGVKIRDLIHQTASKEVAHTDRKVGQSVFNANELRVRAAGKTVELHRRLIVGLGKHLAEKVREALASEAIQD